MAFITFQPHDYFNTVTYTGNGGNQTITGVGFKSDWVWFKARDAGQSHALVDSVRGTDKVLFSESTAAEGSITSQTFNSDGFDLVQTATANSINSSSSTKVAWCWRASNATAVSNTDGNVTTTVSANTTSGFSIVKYTNPSSGSPFTVGHGLGAAPKMIITKKLNGTQTWGVWHTGIGFGKYLRLDSTAAEASANLVTATSTTTFSTYKDHHDTGDDIIAYCFAPVKGFSKFGVYYGDASADGPFIYTGFKPGLIILKRASNSGNNWNMIDSKRSPSNDVDKILFPSSNDVEVTTTVADILSTGFKIRLTSSGWNHNQDKFIYMAFAEEPLVSSNNVPATAR